MALRHDQQGILQKHSQFLAYSINLELFAPILKVLPHQPDREKHRFVMKKNHCLGIRSLRISRLIYPLSPMTFLILSG